MGTTINIWKTLINESKITRNNYLLFGSKYGHSGLSDAHITEGIPPVKFLFSL